jgi:hypothetical protein
MDACTPMQDAKLCVEEKLEFERHVTNPSTTATSLFCPLSTFGHVAMFRAEQYRSICLPDLLLRLNLCAEIEAAPRTGWAMKSMRFCQLNR